MTNNSNNTTTSNNNNNTSLFLPDKVLGSGSFSTVHYGTHTPTSHPVALKILDGHAIHDDAENKKRVLREIHHLHIASGHGNIVTLYDVYSLDHTDDNDDENNNDNNKKWQDVVLAMEYAGGGDLHDYVIHHGTTVHNHTWSTMIKKCFSSARDCSGGLPPTQVQSFMKQILSGLYHLHSHHIVHRDLKLDNLLLSTSKSRILIADLGLSAIITPHRNNGYLTTSCGSPHYAAPEILDGKPYQGYPIDVWSLGVILYCMICGRLPFRDEEIKTMFRKIKMGQYERMRWWSIEEKDILEGMLCVNVEKRLGLMEVMEHSLWKNENGGEKIDEKGEQQQPLQNQEKLEQVDNDNSERTNSTVPSSCASSFLEAGKGLETDAATTFDDDEYHEEVVDQVVSLYKTSKVEIIEKNEKAENQQTKAGVTKDLIKQALLTAKQTNKKCIINEMEGKEDDDILTILNDHHENNENSRSSSLTTKRGISTTCTVTIKDLICTYQILLDDKREEWMQLQQLKVGEGESDRSSVRKITEGLLSHFGGSHD